MIAEAGSAAAAGLDHVGFVTDDGSALWGAFERLGFQLTPFSRHAGRVVAGGPIETMGTGNRCAMLRRGYLELLAIVDKSLPVDELDRLSARYDGIHILALAIADEAAALQRLRDAGIEVPGVMHLERQVDAADPASPMARFARLPVEDAPEGRIQLIRHLTPEAIWQERWLSHPNRAVSLEAIILAVPDPAAAAARFSRLAGRPVVPDPASGFALELAHGVVRLLPPEAVGAVLPGVAMPSLPCIAGIVVRTDDEAAAARDRSALIRVPDGWMATAGGAGIVFA